MYVGMSCLFMNAIKNCMFLLWFWAFFWMQEIRHKWDALSSCSRAIVRIPVLSSWKSVLWAGRLLWFLGQLVLEASWNGKGGVGSVKEWEGSWEDVQRQKGGWQRPSSKETARWGREAIPYHVLSRGLRLTWGSEVPLKGVVFRSMFSLDLDCL